MGSPRLTMGLAREVGLLDRADDVFYLTLDEVWDFTKGRAALLRE